MTYRQLLKKLKQMPDNRLDEPAVLYHNDEQVHGSNTVPGMLLNIGDINHKDFTLGQVMGLGIFDKKYKLADLDDKVTVLHT